MTKLKSTMLVILLVVGVFGSLQTKAAAAKVNIKCGHDQEAGYAWNYCELDALGSTSQDVLYFFHGAGGNEHQWQNSKNFKKVYSLWGASAPKVITISYGQYWLLADKNSSMLSGLYVHFIQTALPAIEKKLNLRPAHRMLMGVSMGGFNATQVYLKNPELMSRVGLACPAIATVPPYASGDEIAAYEQRTGATASYVNDNLSFSLSYFPDPKSWGQAAPIVQAKIRTNSRFPAIYVTGGMQDEFGFQEGSKAFVDAVKQNGGAAEWKPLPGKHCTWDVEGMALFFLAGK